MVPEVTIELPDGTFSAEVTRRHSASCFSSHTGNKWPFHGLVSGIQVRAGAQLEEADQDLLGLGSGICGFSKLPRRF